MTALPNQDEPAPPPADELYADLPGVLNDDDIQHEYQRSLDADPEAVAWHIDSPELAEWAMAKLTEAAADDAALLAQRDAQMERAQAWYARVSKRPKRTVSFMRGHLEDYALRQRQATGRATLVLPNGDVATRKGADSQVAITDADALVQWAREHARSIVQTTHKVLVSDLRTIATIKGDTVVTEAGEVIPGTAITEPGGPTATVKPH